MSAVLDSGVNSHALLSHNELGFVGVMGLPPGVRGARKARFGGVLGGDARPEGMRLETCGLGSESRLWH